jgi:phospholipid/cholesterol/gamma-HCH transport system ATP-binding protein
MNKIIEVNNLTIGYEGRAILKDLSFSVFEGEIFFIMGGSGSGKTTLLKNLIGLNTPLSGQVIINGIEMKHQDYDERRKLMTTLGVTFQEGALMGSLTLGENISLVLEEYTAFSKTERRKKALEKLSLVGLEDFIDYYPSEISGGMKKRAGLARALALDPKVLFFDEPSAGLDPISSAELDRLIMRLGRELHVTVVVVSHELDSAYSIADRALLIDNKTRGIAEIANPYEILKKTNNRWVKRFLARDGLARKI